MGQNTLKRASSYIVCGLLVFASLAKADQRPEDQILADIKAVTMPSRPTDRSDVEALKAFSTAQQEALVKKSELIGELFKSYPNNAELPSLMPIRLQVLRGDKSKYETLKSEADALIATSKDEKLIAEAYYSKGFAAYLNAKANTNIDDLVAEEFVYAQKLGKDPRAASGLLAVSTMVKDLAKKEALFQRIEKEFPSSTAAKQVPGYRARLEGDRKKLERVGKPFELEFTDAIKGTQVSMANLKGKVVVIDFWATWCGPCIAEIPNMKKLYAEYKDKGVEFIGVSLDQPKEKGGLDKLKDYVAKNNLEWPQYYQGNYWNSEFSSSWDIKAIPCVFLVDADGNLASVEARGKLETLIPEYLEKAKAKKTAANP